eukprot:g675.t1
MYNICGSRKRSKMTNTAFATAIILLLIINITMLMRVRDSAGDVVHHRGLQAEDDGTSKSNEKTEIRGFTDYERKSDFRPRKESGFVLRRLWAVEEDLYRSEYRLKAMEKQIGLLSKVARSTTESRKGDVKKLAQLRERVDTIENLMRKFPDLLEKIEDDSKSSFLTLSTRLENMRATMRDEVQLDTGAKEARERAISGELPHEAFDISLRAEEEDEEVGSRSLGLSTEESPSDRPQIPHSDNGRGT